MNNNENTDGFKRGERPKESKRKKDLPILWKLTLGFLAALIIIGLSIWVSSIGQPQTLWEDDFSSDKSNWGVNSTSRILTKSPVGFPKDYEGKSTLFARKEEGAKESEELWPNCKDIRDTKKPFFVSVTVIPEGIPQNNSSFGLVVRDSSDNQRNQPTKLNSGNFYKLDLVKSISSISSIDQSPAMPKIESRKPYRLKIEFSTTSVNFYINETPLKGENSSGNFEPSFSFLGREIKEKCIGFFPSSNEKLYFYDFLAKTYLPDIEQDLRNAIKIKDEDIKSLSGRLIILEQKLDSKSQPIDIKEPVSQRLATIESKLEGEKTKDGKIVNGNEIASSEPVGKRLSELKKQVKGIIDGSETVTVQAQEKTNPSTTLTKIYEDQKIILSVDTAFQKNLKAVFSNLR